MVGLSRNVYLNNLDLLWRQARLQQQHPRSGSSSGPTRGKTLEPPEPTHKTALNNLPLQLHGKVTLVKIYLLRRNRHFEIKIRCQKEMQFFPVPNTTSWSMKMQI